MKRIVTCALLVAGVALGRMDACAEPLPAPADTLALRERTTPIKEITVNAARLRHDVRHLPMTVTVVERPQIEESHRSSLLPTLTEHTAGLFTTSRGVMGYGVSGGAAGQISIRGIGGAPTTAVMVLVDGRPQYMGIMGHPIADACHSMSAERVEVLRGPASVLYGSGAMGGVINIVTRQSGEEGVAGDINLGYGSFNTLQSEAVVKGRHKGVSVTAGVSYNRTDGHRRNMEFAQCGGFFRTAYEIDKVWRVSADLNVTRFAASQPGSVTSPLEDARQRVFRGSASAAVENGGKRASGALTLFYNWGRHEVEDGHAPTAAPLDYRFRSRDGMLGISLFESVQLWRGARLTVGAEWHRYGGRKWNERTTDSGEATGEKFAELDKTLHEVAGYVDLRQHIDTWLTFDAGLRVDWNSHSGIEYIPQVGAAFHLPHSIELKLSAAKGFRSPTIRELYMLPQRNPDLRAERIWSYEAAFSQKLLEGRLYYGINLFYINGDNMVVTVPREGSTPRFENSGAVENCGVEAEIGWQIAPAWRTEANYSYTHMEHPVIATPEHKLYVGASFRKGRWSASTGVQYINNLYTETGSTPRTDLFVLWNVRAELRTTRWLSIWVRGENLLAARYEINAGYPMPKATFMGGVSISLSKQTTEKRSGR